MDDMGDSIKLSRKMNKYQERGKSSVLCKDDGRVVHLLYVLESVQVPGRRLKWDSEGSEVWMTWRVHIAHTSFPCDVHFEHSTLSLQALDAGRRCAVAVSAV